MARSNRKPRTVKIGLMAVSDRGAMVLAIGSYLLVEKIKELCPEKAEMLGFPQLDKKMSADLLEGIVEDSDELVKGLHEILPQVSEAITYHKL